MTTPAEKQQGVIAPTRAGGGQIGGARDYQEDDYRLVQIDDDALLLILADGMGGHVGGARASDCATSTLARHYIDALGDASGSISEKLVAALDAANDAIAAAVAADGRYRGMGCTLVACVIADNILHWVSVGDSPLWLCRGRKLTRLNADHSMRPQLEGLVKLGRMTPEELAEDGRVHQLRAAVMGEELAMLDANKEGYPLMAGDRLLLASDGVETLSLAAIAAIVTAARGPAESVAKLLDAVTAEQKPRQDNATALVYHHAPDSPMPPNAPGAVHEQERTTQRMAARPDGPVNKSGAVRWVVAILVACVILGGGWLGLRACMNDEVVSGENAVVPVVKIARPGVSSDIKPDLSSDSSSELLPELLPDSSSDPSLDSPIDTNDSADPIQSTDSVTPATDDAVDVGDEPSAADKTPSDAPSN